MPLAKKRKGRVCVPSEKLRYLFGVDVKILVNATPSTNSSFFGLVFFIREAAKRKVGVVPGPNYLVPLYIARLVSQMRTRL